jgi:hypothetical protein
MKKNDSSFWSFWFIIEEIERKGSGPLLYEKEIDKKSVFHLDAPAG